MIFLLFTLSQALVPILFAPGWDSSRLWVEVDDNAKPSSCPALSNGLFLLSDNITLMMEYPQCFHDLMKLEYDSSNNRFYQQSGVRISIPGFGTFSDISQLYKPFYETVLSWNYTEGKDLFFIPYDYRWMTAASLKNISLFSRIQQLVEKAYTLNGNRRVVLIGHSNGGPTIYSFLVSSDRDWTDKHIAAFIGLSGNFAGQIDGYDALIYDSEPVVIFGHRDLDRSLMGTWESNYVGTPFGPAFGDLVVITTFANDSTKTSNYTTSLNDITMMFEEADQPQMAQKLKSVYPDMNKTMAPNVDTYCFYGLGIPTTMYYKFDGNIFSPFSLSTQGDGDGNQDYIDNEFCEIWYKTMPPQYYFEPRSFPGVHHMQMYSDPTVMAAVQQVLAKY